MCASRRPAVGSSDWLGPLIDDSALGFIASSDGALLLFDRVTVDYPKSGFLVGLKLNVVELMIDDLRILGNNKIGVTMAILPSARKPHKPKLLDQLRDDDAASALVRAMRSNLTFVTFLTL
jgi:hypothetical protein